MCFIIRCPKLMLTIVARIVQVVAAGLVQSMAILDYFQIFGPKATADSFTPVKTYACSKYISALDPKLASRKHHSLIDWADLQFHLLKVDKAMEVLSA